MTLRASVYGRQSSGNAKSIKEQLVAGYAAVAGNGWSHAGDYSDGVGASRYRKKKRDDWERLLADLAAGVFDVLILWESSRGDRTLTSWAQFLELCRNHNILVHVIADDHTYDLNRPRDWKTLANAGVDAAAETDLLSIRVKRGHAGAAAMGKPPGGPTPYGYRRYFDPTTGKRTGQKPDEAEAVIVREICRKIAGGHTVLGLANDLNERGVPAPSLSGRWDTSAIRRIARSPAYIGVRVLNDIEHRGDWEPLIDEGLHYAARQFLNDPTRKVTRPGRQKHLLTYLAVCHVCESWIDYAATYYKCKRAGCVSMPKEITDRIVSGQVIRRLTRTDAVTLLADDSEVDIRDSRAKVAKLRAQLDEWRASALRGETSPGSLAVIERGLMADIEALEVEIRKLLVPAPLKAILNPDDDMRTLLGPGSDIEARWDAAPIVAKRLFISALCDIRIDRGRPGRPRGGADQDEWNLPRLAPSKFKREAGTWGDYWEAA